MPNPIETNPNPIETNHVLDISNLMWKKQIVTFGLIGWVLSSSQIRARHYILIEKKYMLSAIKLDHHIK
jgi:hypothetical protein